MADAVTPRARAYGLLDPDSHAHGARQVRALGVALIIIGIASVSAGTVDNLPDGMRTVAAAVTGLVLNVADFYQLAGQQPTLIAAIEAEARRRRATDGQSGA